MTGRTLSLAVVGVAHPNNDKSKSNRRFEIMICKPGDPVGLMLEPKNPVDPHAVMVFSERGVQLGYLTAERAPWIGAMIHEGREVETVFQESTPYGCVIRAGIDGAKPILPEPRETETFEVDESHADDDIGFWPDYIPPDD